MNKITQGTVIYGMRSEKYPEVTSYAIVISARCDIANSKISKLYYLTAINAKEWFCTLHGFQEVYHKYVQSQKSNLKEQLANFEINVDLLFQLKKEQAEQILCKKVTNAKKRNQLTDTYQKIYQFLDANVSFENRKQLIRKTQNPLIEFLQQITKGVLYHYFFIPQKAYLDNEKMDNGLIVDLQEIGIMSINDATRIQSPGIDYQTLPDEKEEERKRLRTKYWLEDDSDFVALEGTIIPPWCELMMQRFSNDFIRIGVDGPKNTDFIELAKAI